MASTSHEVEDRILDEIVKIIDGSGNATYKSRAVLDLAEAYAWVVSPGQPHGGSASKNG